MVVTTPHSLLRLLQYQSLLFLRLCHLLLDEVEVLLSEANEQVSVSRSFRCHYYLEIFIYMCIYISEKAMAPHSSTLAWKIPWTEEPGRLQSMGSWRVRHDWATSLSLFTFMHWRRKWQPTPVFLPGESQGRGSLVGCHLWCCTELDTTEAT